MEFIAKDPCSFEGKRYDHGEELCDEHECLVCMNGKWVDMENLASSGC